MILLFHSDKNFGLGGCGGFFAFLGGGFAQKSQKRQDFYMQAAPYDQQAICIFTNSNRPLPFENLQALPSDRDTPSAH